MGSLRSPDLIDCILCDHSCTLTLFNSFFSASGRGTVLGVGSHPLPTLTGLAACPDKCLQKAWW